MQTKKSEQSLQAELNKWNKKIKAVWFQNMHLEHLKKTQDIFFFKEMYLR